MSKRILGGIAAVMLLVSAGSVWAHEGHHHHGAQAGAQQALSEEAGKFDPGLLGFSGARELFNVHPIFVHFPIALFPSALLLYGLGIVFNWRAACSAGRACLYLAAAGTLLAVMTGLRAQETFPHNARIHHMMQTHKTIGIALFLMSTLLVVWGFLHQAQRPKAAYPFLIVLAATTYLVLQNADLGGRMVFIEGAAVKPAVSVISGDDEETQDTTGQPIHHDHGVGEAVETHEHAH